MFIYSILAKENLLGQRSIRLWEGLIFSEANSINRWRAAAGLLLLKKKKKNTKFNTAIPYFTVPVQEHLEISVNVIQNRNHTERNFSW